MSTDGAARDSLRLPEARLLSKEHAAAYLGIGVTLLEQLGVPHVKFGRRCVYDRIDLDAWLDEYKSRGRARKEHSWPVKAASTGDGTPVSGGSMSYCPAADAYAEALRPPTGRKRKPT
jgi:hypothetical protein